MLSLRTSAASSSSKLITLRASWAASPGESRMSKCTRLTDFDAVVTDGTLNWIVGLVRLGDDLAMTGFLSFSME